MNSTSIEWSLIIAALFPWACITAAALMTPRLTRPDLFFSVTVKPSFRVSPDGARILSQYYRIIAIAAVVALFPILLLNFSRSLLLIGLLGPVAVELAGFFGAFLVARRKTIPFHVDPTAQREAEVAPRQVSLPGGWMAQAGPFLIFAAIAVCLWINWDRIPARIAIHWGVGGAPDGWAPRSAASVFTGDAVGAAFCGMLAGLCYAILRGVRRIYSSGPAGLREARFARRMSLVLLGAEYWLALLMGTFSLAALRENPAAPLPAFWPIVVGQAIFVGAIFLIVYRTGQGGWRLEPAAESGDSNADALPVGDRTPDECWKLGLFYFNPNDSAMFVEKRFGVGWTLNFGNARAWFVIAALLLFLVAGLSLSLIISHNASR